MAHHRLNVISAADRFFALLVLAILVGCASGIPSTRPAASGGDAEAPAGMLPALPDDSLTRGVSVDQINHILGSSTFARSANCIPIGGDLLVPAGPQGLEWAMYRFTPAGTETPKSVTFNMSFSFGTQAWIAVANYAKGYWEFKGPYPGPTAPKQFSGFDFGGYTSPGGSLYFLAFAIDNTTLTMNSLDVLVDGPAPTVFSVSGTVTDTSTGQGLSGVSLRLDPGAFQQTSAANGTFSFTGLSANSYTLSPMLSGYTFNPVFRPVAVASDVTGQDFDATPIQVQVTYTNTMKAIFDARCIECHSESFARAGRKYDTYANAKLNGDAGLVEVLSNRMPESGPLPQNEKNSFQAWKDDGYLQ